MQDDGVAPKFYAETGQAFREANIEALQRALGGAPAAVVGSLYGFPWWADAPPARQFRDVIDMYAPDTETVPPLEASGNEVVGDLTSTCQNVQG